MKIKYCSAPCGSGKTYQLIEAACRIANRGDIVLFLQPTKELIDKTINDELLLRPNPPPYEKIYGSSSGNSVARQITEYLNKPMDGGHIIFASHQVVPFVRFWPNQYSLHVIIDEELQVVKHGWFQIPDTHRLITDCIELEAHDAIYGRVSLSDPEQLEQIAKNKARDEIFERFRETAQILGNEHWESFINAEQFEKLKAGTAKQLSMHSVLKPDVLIGFASVTMASANFHNTLLYRLWTHQGVRFEEDKELSRSLRFQSHQNGGLISIKYLTDRDWSMYLQRTLCDPESKQTDTALNVVVQAVKEEFQDQPFLWQGNKWIGDGVFGSHGQRLPNVPHGLNDYSGYDRIAFLSALNPRTDHFGFLKRRGVDPDAVRRAIYGSAVYQSVMRTSIRDPESTTEKIIIVPCASAARYLQGTFPGSQVEKLQTSMTEADKTAKTIRGRQRKYNSSAERQRAYRRRKRQAEQQTSFHQNSFPYVVKNSCGQEGLMNERYENAIGINTHFVSHEDVHGTFYKEIESNIPICYPSGGNTDEFFGLLEYLHERTVANKEANFLISPAVFDPNHPKAEGKTKRGLDNIVAMRHLWMDFENGDLHPEEIPELFPQIRLAVFNSYNHTKDAPRFRVVIPFYRTISAEEYGALYKEVIAKIEDAGYSVGNDKGYPRSGLDASKKTPGSLFYLPCQAKEPSESFFNNYNDENRKILDPLTWIKNTVVHLSKLEVRKDTHQTPSKEVDQAAVENATRIWRKSPEHPNEGDDRFFKYALSLRKAGMSSNDIEQKLQENAKFGRSEDDRSAQIPSIMRTLSRPFKKSA